MRPEECSLKTVEPLVADATNVGLGYIGSVGREPAKVRCNPGSGSSANGRVDETSACRDYRRRRSWSNMAIHEARVASASMANRQPGVASLIDNVWGAILLIPTVTLISATHGWDLGAVYLLAATAVFFGLLRAILGLRIFLVLTYVPALFGVLAVAADLLRDVNLLEAALIRPDPNEAWPVIQPHAHWIALTAVLLAVPIWMSFRTPSTRAAPSFMTPCCARGR